jgi:hypothetical protein
VKKGQTQISYAPKYKRTIKGLSAKENESRTNIVGQRTREAKAGILSTKPILDAF